MNSEILEPKRTHVTWVPAGDFHRLENIMQGEIIVLDFVMVILTAAEFSTMVFEVAG